MKQKDVAALSGMTQAYISKIELGATNATITTIGLVCAAIGIDPASLLVRNALTSRDVADLLMAISRAIRLESIDLPPDTPLTIDLLCRALRGLDLQSNRHRREPAKLGVAK